MAATEQNKLSVSLILPCFNEMEHIERSFKKIYDFAAFTFSDHNFEIILVDDGSVDGTREWLERLSAPQVIVVLNAKNLGRGAAVKKGLEASSGQVVGFMDIDCEMSEAYIPKFVQSVSSGVDLAIGRRIYNVSMNPYVLFRHFLSLGYKALLRLTLNLGISDSEVGYKFFSRSFAEFIVEQSQFDHWFWDTETCLLAERYGFTTAEIVGAFVRNADKTSTVHVWRDSIRYFKALQKFKRLMASGAYSRPRNANFVFPRAG